MAPGGPSFNELQRTNPEMQFITYNDVHTRTYTWRNDKPPFNDVRVRRAIALGYNQEEYIATQSGMATPVYGVIPSFMAEYYLSLDDLGENAQWWKFNVEKAKALLAEAGYPGGFRTPMKVTSSSPEQYAADFFVATFGRIGIKADLEVLPHPVAQRTIFRSEYEAGIVGGAYRAWDPVHPFTYLTPGNLRNQGHVNDPWVVEKTQEIQRTVDKAKRKQLITEVTRYLAGQVYYIVLNAKASRVLQPWVKNYVPQNDYSPGRWHQYVWIDKG